MTTSVKVPKCSPIVPLKYQPQLYIMHLASYHKY